MVCPRHKGADTRYTAQGGTKAQEELVPMDYLDPLQVNLSHQVGEVLCIAYSLTPAVDRLLLENMSHQVGEVLYVAYSLAPVVDRVKTGKVSKLQLLISPHLRASRMMRRGRWR